MSDYKFKIDKDLLDKFFLTNEPITAEVLKEIDKVFNVVLIKHYSRYTNEFEELKSFALFAIMKRRESYDPSFSSYNYIYSIARNEIGNKIAKMSKEVYFDDLLKFRNRIDESSEAELPDEIIRYQDYLTGEKDFTVVRVPKKDAVNIIIFLRMFESRRDCTMPSFLEPTLKTVKVLYKLLKEMIDNGTE